MDYINIPDMLPDHVSHHTLFSKLYQHEIGYNIYLPPDYENGEGTYPITYHLHGWMGNESSEMGVLGKVYQGGQRIMVFPNNSPMIEDREYLPVEDMFFADLMPHIEGRYRVNTARDARSISGFSMGGGSAFLYALNHVDVFSSVTAYAGTYHHYFHKEAQTVGVPMNKAAEILEQMLSENRQFDDENILCTIRRYAESPRQPLAVSLHIGTGDILACDNEIVHLYMNKLNIPHEYTRYDGVEHELRRIV